MRSPCFIFSARRSNPVSTSRVDGPCWRIVKTGHPSTRAVNSASGNRNSVTAGHCRTHSVNTDRLPSGCFSVNDTVTAYCVWADERKTPNTTRKQHDDCILGNTVSVVCSVCWNTAAQWWRVVSPTNYRIDDTQPHAFTLAVHCFSDCSTIGFIVRVCTVVARLMTVIKKLIRIEWIYNYCNRLNIWEVLEKSITIVIHEVLTAKLIRVHSNLSGTV